MIAGALVAVHYGGADDRAAISETIVISGDAGLESSEYVTGGNGTAASPYLIEDLSILVSTGEHSHDCYGITLAQTQAHLKIRNVTFDIDPELLPEFMSDRCGIALWGSRNVTVESCTFTFTNLGKGIMVDSVSMVNASGNTFSGCLAGISFEDTSELCDASVLMENDFRQCKYGIYVYSWLWSVDIRNNSFVLCEIGIGGYDVSNLNITDNYIEDSKVAAISLRSPSLVNVERNHILYSGNGIVFDDGYLITIDSNHIEVTGAGILVSRSTEITITRNEIDGTSMLDVSVGVFIDASTSVNVTFNALWHSGVGIQVLADDDSGTAVVIHHNGFFGNDVQAIDCEGDSNLWDDGVSGGNYWSDYTGEDLDSDGVGDTPYTIDSDSIDRYPLMSNPTL